MKIAPPFLLYKIVSVENWEESQSSDFLLLSFMDQKCIHFATESQWKKVVMKYWKDVVKCILITVEADKLVGDMVLEKNPGGNTLYYHLYNGIIYKEAIVKKTVIFPQKLLIN